MAREIGILMSPPMIVAELDKTKRQTRRTQGLDAINKEQADWACGSVVDGLVRFYNSKTKQGLNVKSRYQIGDHLYSKEIHFKYGRWVDDQFYSDIKTQWRFIPNHAFGVWFPDNLPKHLKLKGAIKTGHGDIGWYKRPSLFMFKNDARIWSTVLKVEAQQLKDITEEDAMAEGMSEKVATYLGYSLMNHHPDDGTYYRHIYKLLWGHLNGTWTPGLWVFKYTMSEPEIRK